jgi:hypothetical protein
MQIWSGVLDPLRIYKYEAPEEAHTIFQIDVFAPLVEDSFFRGNYLGCSIYLSHLVYLQEVFVFQVGNPVQDHLPSSKAPTPKKIRLEVQEAMKAKKVGGAMLPGDTEQSEDQMGVMYYEYNFMYQPFASDRQCKYVMDPTKIPEDEWTQT